MAHDDGGGELLGEPLQEGPHTVTLGLGARVAGIAGSIQTALIADADAVLVVALAVGTHLPQRTTLMHLAVAGDVIMVTDVFVAEPLMVGLALPERVLLGGAGGAAVQHDKCYCSHGLFTRGARSLKFKV